MLSFDLPPPPLLWREHRRFTAALLFSALLHLFLLAHPGALSLSPGNSSFSQPLTARLLPAPEQPPAALKEAPAATVMVENPPQPRAKPKRKSMPKTAPAATPVRPVETPKPSPAPPPSEPPSIDSAPSEAPAPAAPPAALPSEAPAPAESAEAPLDHSALLRITRDGGQPFGLPTSAMSGMVGKVTLRFALSSGAEGQPAGYGKHEFVAGIPDFFGVRNQYSLRVSEDGEAVQEGWRLGMSGQISSSGLGPWTYARKGRTPDALSALVDQGGAETEASGRIPDGLLDRQSLFYQFSVRPPKPEGGRLWISDGRDQQIFEYRLDGTEHMELAGQGRVNTLRVVLQGHGETITLWLLPEMLHLPVKARFVKENGEVREQRALSLDFSLQ